nr:ABC transporter permease [uncultured Draconibacterium sp.]
MKLQNNIKLTLRTFAKNKGVTLLNLIGLSVGITASLLIFLFVQKEKSTDKYIPDLENIYVLNNENDRYLSQGMVNHIKNEIAEFQSVTYCGNDWSSQIFLEYNNESYAVKNMLNADSAFFRVFNFSTVYGNPQQGLNRSDEIVLTRSLSQKLFGNENPIGKNIIYNATYLTNQNLTVTAVIDDLPQSSSWNFDAVLSLPTMCHLNWYKRNMEKWGTQNYNAFAKLNPNVSEDMANEKLANIDLAAVPDGFKEDTHYGAAPFKNAYFEMPDLERMSHGNKLTLSIIAIIGVLILLLSCVNYINMVTAQQGKRYKSFGLFKTMGDNRWGIIHATTTEAAMLLIAAVFISLVFTTLLLPGLNSLTSSRFTNNALFNGNFMGMIIFILGIMILITGIIPGYIFSNKPTTELIRKTQTSQGNPFLRNGLLVFQFVVSIALISSIFIINRQNSFIQNCYTGFTKDNIVYVNTNDDISSHINAFKNELKQMPGIQDITFSENVLIEVDQEWGTGFVNKGETYDVNFKKMSVAPNFFAFFNIPIKEGQTFSENSKNRSDVIINETAKADFKIDQLNDARFTIGGDNGGNIVGMASNYNFESLHVPIMAQVYMASGDCDNVLYLKVNASNMATFKSTMSDVEKAWNDISPMFPMEYQFLDQTYAAQYAKEAQFQKFLLYTTLISLILSCLGLIGLTYFIMEQRTKEIGVRKVNGATISEVITLLNKDFVKWVAIAFIIATPIAWYAMHKWLENFAYKTTLSWWIFALSGVMALGIALLTVSWQSWKAATRNPVEALRYE